ncbi:hypothetical protein IEQ34_006936 [Dendrobium chrysotoxum]|uniref:Uncharacterized protein n=1 Tax=Dendrobium chrysotoxum TaxID=161865 RepID=A0AAV7H9J7_DENCH|nr:hypothetical protein IEQ34_006936 [Dendrobium chrysotoxum]
MLVYSFFNNLCSIYKTTVPDFHSSFILIRSCNRFIVPHHICSSHSLLSSPAKSDGIMPLLLPSLHILTISSSHNPKPKSPSPHPPLLLRFRPSDRQIAQHLNTLGIRASPSYSSESLHWMLSVANYFESKGFSNIHFPRLFHLCPQIFSSTDINRTIAPVFSFLISELGASTEQSRDFIVRCPELLNCNVEFRLRPTLVFLREIGVYNLHVPSILNANLLIIPVGQLGSRIRFLESMGLSYEESSGICRRFPSIFRYSEENNLRPKFEYLLYEMGGSVEEVKRFPQYFGFCLKKRIVPRHLHLKQRNIRPSLKWMLMPGDKKFYGKLACKQRLTQSTKLSSIALLSTGLFPVISSRSITPNEKTSDFSVSLPLDAYSGARYLNIT